MDGLISNPVDAVLTIAILIAYVLPFAIYRFIFKKPHAILRVDVKFRKKTKKEYICRNCGSILPKDLDKCNVCGSRIIRRLV